MSVLTTRQRDLLQILLRAQAPLGAAELAAEMQLTARQVGYDLKGIRRWLARQEIELKVTPGQGVELNCPPEQYTILTQELNNETNFQLVLTVEQRQQLIAIVLLVVTEPMILYQLEQLVQMSRTTLLKDLDEIETWLETMSLTLERRPNYGVCIQGRERRRRQALTALIWGETPFGLPLTRLSHEQGLAFPMGADAALLPIVDRAAEIIARWDVRRSFAQVAYAEAQLGGRFTDDAVLYLALTLALQTGRVAAGHYLSVDDEMVDWLQTSPVWPVAEQIAHRQGWQTPDPWPEDEVADVAMHILSTPRNERWPGDLDIDAGFSTLIDDLMEQIEEAYALPALSQDRTLRDGLVIHIIPACLRQRFNLWAPPSAPATILSDKYTFEHKLAHRLAANIAEQTEVMLPANEVNGIALLLRAAYIRERPNRTRRVFVVCPSGMATAQLLVARLKARFPHLSTLEVLSLRELNPTTSAAAELIITTTPLPEAIQRNATVIQVHPLLLPEDVEAITQWLA